MARGIHDRSSFWRGRVILPVPSHRAPGLRHVRGLAFPNFHQFKRGFRTCGNTNGYIKLIPLCPNLRKAHISLEVSTGTDTIRRHAVQKLKTRYSLQQVCERPMLNQVPLELKYHFKGVANIEEGESMFGYGEELTDWFREQLNARAEERVMARTQR
jgi:hypothetical protein